MSDQAHARKTDPQTSWDAADSLDGAQLRASQNDVLTVLQSFGPLSDEQLVVRLQGRMSPSGARTRRSELVAKGVVRDTGQRVTLASGRKAIVWEAGVKANAPRCPVCGLALHDVKPTVSPAYAIGRCLQHRDQVVKL